MSRPNSKRKRFRSMVDQPPPSGKAAKILRGQIKRSMGSCGYAVLAGMKRN